MGVELSFNAVGLASRAFFGVSGLISTCYRIESFAIEWKALSLRNPRIPELPVSEPEALLRQEAG